MAGEETRNAEAIAVFTCETTLAVVDVRVGFMRRPELSLRVRNEHPSKLVIPVLVNVLPSEETVNFAIQIAGLQFFAFFMGFSPTADAK